MRDPGRLAVRRLSELESVRRLAPEWMELRQREARSTPFQGPEWLLPWIETFRPHELWLLEVRDREKLTGVAPLFAYRRETGERSLAILGAGISDYLDFIVDPAYAHEVLQAIFEFMRNAEGEWNQVELLDLRRESPIITGAPTGEWEAERLQHDVCPRLALPAGVEELRQVIPSRQRRNLRTAINRTRREGKMTITIATPATLAEHLDALLQLHGARWRETGEPGVLANAAVREFHWKAAPLLLEAGVLRLYGLRLNGELIAALYTLWERDVVYLYLQGFNTAYGEFSPGMQIVAAVAHDALRERKKAIDFLRGREPYKYSWGAQDEATYRLVLRRRNESQRLTSRADAAWGPDNSSQEW
jgi:CelD/BcsL family acetyltransferase involved in cellulose biosynthesis